MTTAAPAADRFLQPERQPARCQRLKRKGPMGRPGQGRGRGDFAVDFYLTYRKITAGH